MQNSTAICVQIPSMGLIHVSGPDAAKFLQGQLTCDVNEVTETTSRLGAYCNQQGRVYSTFRIFRLKNDFYLWLPKDLVETVITTLRKYVIFSKVTLTDCREQFAYLGYLDAEAALINHYGTLPSKVDDVIPLPQGCLIRLPGKESRYLLINEPSAAAISLPQSSEQCWQLADIQAGIPLITLSTSAEFTPHALNYHLINGISFTKGCYIGQEIIARTQYRGQVKQHLYPLKILTEQSVNVADKITNTQQTLVGTIINVAEIEKNNFVALAVIHENAIQAKDILYANSPVEILESP